MSRTAIMYVTERCNQACVFCLEEDGTALRPDVPPQQVAEDLATLRARGAEHITFMGGETFLRKDLATLLGDARALGFTRLGVTTNGSVLAHPGFLLKMVEAGLAFVEISIHADSPELAERISGKGFTWERQQRALSELESLRDRIDVIVDLVICRENHDRVEPIVRRLLDEHPNLKPIVKLKFVSLIGAADCNDGQALRYDDVDLAPALALLTDRGVRHWTYNFPLCRVGGARHSHEAQAFVLDWRYHDYDHRKRDGYYDSGFQLEGNVWPERSCASCVARPICPGLEETYRRMHGDAVLAPLALDPVAETAAILADAGRDPARASGVLAQLRAQPRPSQFHGVVQAKPGEVVIELGHADWPEPLLFELGAARPDQPAFAATERMRLCYRRSERDPGTHPDGRKMLDALAAALRQADAVRETIAAAAERLAAAAVSAGWSRVAVRLGPKPPDADAPLAIRAPVRREAR